MSGLTILIILILAPPVLVTGFFALEVLTGLVPLRQPGSTSREASAVIVIPAHDEEQVIGQTVAEIRKDPSAALRVLVVADNCADRTAEVARAAGGEVVIRDEPERRGKGFALAAARDHLRAAPPDVVVVIDADCRIDGASLEALVAAAAGSRRPCQSVNLLQPDLKAAPLVQLSTFAFMIKNLVRQRALQRLGHRVHLTGTGMALPWNIFSAANLGGANIVEDLALGLELAERAPPMLIEGATIWSPAASAGGTLVQRRRWEGGYLATAFRKAPSAFARSLMRADLRGLAAALDLSVPPLALLAVLNAAALLLALGGALAGAAWWPAVVLLAVGVIAAAAVVLAWLSEGRRFASGTTLLRLPFYVLWKAPLYAGMVFKGVPKEWLRSGR